MFRPATRADIEAFYPNLTQTVRAWTVELNGEPLGVGGVYYQGDIAVAFSAFKPELDKWPMTKLRGLKKIMEIVGDRSCIAIADEKFPDAPKLLERIGFQHIEGRTYKWPASSATCSKAGRPGIRR